MSEPLSFPVQPDPAALGAAEPDVTVVVCSSCRDASGSDERPRAGQLLAQAVRDAAEPGIAVTTVECLGNCRRRLSAALVRPGAWDYVFGDLSLENGPDLIAGAKLLAGAQDGFMPWRGRPDCLKRGLVARIPPLSLFKEPA